MLRFLRVALILEVSAMLWLSILTAEFFYHAYETSSRDHLPVSFLAALVILVLGTQGTAMSFRREKLRAASGLPTAAAQSFRHQVTYIALAAFILLAAAVLIVILEHRLI